MVWPSLLYPKSYKTFFKWYLKKNKKNFKGIEIDSVMCSTNQNSSFCKKGLQDWADVKEWEDYYKTTGFYRGKGPVSAADALIYFKDSCLQQRPWTFGNCIPYTNVKTMEEFAAYKKQYTDNPIVKWVLSELPDRQLFWNLPGMAIDVTQDDITEFLAERNGKKLKITV